ncbi:MAG: EamA family transporter, partial [Treponema sp.]|nr:EamA family transporter [Treponema sp.]
LIGVACILALGIVQIGLPSIMYSIGISGESALTSMLISMIEPVMNPIWVMLIVHEVPSVSAIAGGVIILGTIIARGYIQNKRK